jgi:hypothetical protein
VAVLRGCAEISDLQTALCFFFASRGIRDCAERGWGARAIVGWVDLTMIQRTRPWARDDSVQMLTAAMASEHPAHRALDLAESDPQMTAREWRRVWDSHRNEREELAPEGKPAARSLASREAEQLEAPRAGTDRWHDAHDHPEHAALLLDHALRELMSSLFHLWCAPYCEGQAPLEIKLANVAGVTRGDSEYLHRESTPWSISRADLSLRMRDLLTLGPDDSAKLTPLFTDRFSDILQNGSASTTPFTAECLPRKIAWVVEG